MEGGGIRYGPYSINTELVSLNLSVGDLVVVLNS